MNASATSISNSSWSVRCRLIEEMNVGQLLRGSMGRVNASFGEAKLQKPNLPMAASRHALTDSGKSVRPNGSAILSSWFSKDLSCPRNRVEGALP